MVDTAAVMVLALCVNSVGIRAKSTHERRETGSLIRNFGFYYKPLANAVLEGRHTSRYTLRSSYFDLQNKAVWSRELNGK